MDLFKDFSELPYTEMVLKIAFIIVSIAAAVVQIFVNLRKNAREEKNQSLLTREKNQVNKGGRMGFLRFFTKNNKKSTSMGYETLLNNVGAKPPTQKTDKIFISYKVNSHPDQALAELLHSALKKRGHEPFINTMLPLGVEWAKTLQSQIEKSDYLVVLLSESSVKSEMVLEEVTFAEIHRNKFQRPRLIPIRVQYVKTLPYGLATHLDSKQFALWANDKDTAGLITKVISAVELADVEFTSAATEKLEEDEGDKNKPLPSFDPRILEVPAGAVKLQSPLYIRRDSDEKMERQLQGDGSTITIRAGRQMGKTSLLVRAANFAKMQGHKIVYVDFQQIKPEFRKSLDDLLRYLADEVTLRLKLDDALLAKIWGSSRGGPDKFSQFMETAVLTDQKRLFLAMDEADQLMDVGYKTDFFALVRSWDSRRAFDETWEKLSLAMVISSHPHLLIDDYRQSPFNVGLRIQLEDFDIQQVGRLNDLHGKPLSENELASMLELLGGHPYLTRQAFYTLIDEKMTWVELSKIADGEKSPFNSHLHFYLWQLRDRPELVSGMKEVVTKHKCSDEGVLYRLVAAGLVKEQADNSCVVRCGLYENYFRKTLNA